MMEGTMPVFVSRATSSVAVPVDLAMSNSFAVQSSTTTQSHWRFSACCIIRGACFATFADRLKAVSGSETGKAFGERLEIRIQIEQNGTAMTICIRYPYIYAYVRYHDIWFYLRMHVIWLSDITRDDKIMTYLIVFNLNLFDIVLLTLR